MAPEAVIVRGPVDGLPGDRGQKGSGKPLLPRGTPAGTRSGAPWNPPYRTPSRCSRSWGVSGSHGPAVHADPAVGGNGALWKPDSGAAMLSSRQMVKPSQRVGGEKAKQPQHDQQNPKRFQRGSFPSEPDQLRSQLFYGVAMTGKMIGYVLCDKGNESCRIAASARSASSVLHFWDESGPSATFEFSTLEVTGA